MKPSLLLIFVAVFCLLFGAAILLFDAHEILSKLEAKQWPQVQAEIDTAEIRETQPGSGLWCPFWRYRYVLGGTTYHSDRLEPNLASSRSCFPLPEQAQKELARYPRASRVVAYYQPDNPAHAAILVSAPGYFEYFLLACGSLFAVFGGLLARNLWRSRRVATV
jgi:hypothetical protein